MSYLRDMELYGYWPKFRDNPTSSGHYGVESVNLILRHFFARGREFFRTRRVSQTTFDAALDEFGARGLVELTNLMGYYSVLAFNINAFEQLPPPSDEPFLPV